MARVEARVRVSKKYTVYIPKAVAEAVGISEGSYLRVWVEGSRIVMEPELDPFTYALRTKKYARLSFEEFERESEEMQRGLFGEA